MAVLEKQWWYDGNKRKQGNQDQRGTHGGMAVLDKKQWWYDGNKKKRGNKDQRGTHGGMAVLDEKQRRYEVEAAW